MNRELPEGSEKAGNRTKREDFSVLMRQEMLAVLRWSKKTTLLKPPQHFVHRNESKNLSPAEKP
ncbi:MAG: hypothetical protein HY300_20315 [Verrucomicrobia bacterium]|nr:hypothetical protein [Verrucomicrobiota bacterium]